MIKIDKGIPIPLFKSSRRYPFTDMEIGDSFIVECDRTDCKKVMAAVSGAGRLFRNRMKSNAKFTVKIVENGIRCWRVE